MNLVYFPCANKAAAPVGCDREPGPEVPAPWGLHCDAPQRVAGSARLPGLPGLRPGGRGGVVPGSDAAWLDVLAGSWFGGFRGVAGFLPLRAQRIFTITRGLISPF